MKRNILLTVAYDGTGFSGWQRQPNRTTVQGALESALSLVCGTAITVNGASRTDAGVHAYGQRANFELESAIPVDKLALAVNNRLSSGGKGKPVTGPIRIQKAEEVPLDFHARFDAKGKKYIYKIKNDTAADLFCRNYYYQILKPLDIDAMNAAARFVVGEHDFKCFQAAGGQEKETTVRRIFSSKVCRREQDIIIEITGDGFLYNMVRIITGTLVEVGKGKRVPGEIASVIESKDRRNAGHTAPPQGLYLAEVYYENGGL